MTRCKHLLTTIITVILGVVLAACASRPGIATGGETPSPMDEVSAPDPAAPLGSTGVEVNNVSSVGLPFVPLTLASEPPASQWVVLDKSDPEANAAAVVYSTAAWGDVIVTEYLHTGTQKELLAWESTLKETGCSPVAVPDSDFIGQTCSHDPYVQVTLANGVVALLSESGGHTTIYWIEPAVVEGIKLDPGLQLYVEVQGASGDLSGDEATSLATSLVKGDG